MGNCVVFLSKCAKTPVLNRKLAAKSVPGGRTNQSNVQNNQPGCKVNRPASLSENMNTGDKADFEGAKAGTSQASPDNSQDSGTSQASPSHTQAGGTSQPSHRVSPSGKHGLDDDSDSDETSFKRPSELCVGDLNISTTRKRGSPAVRPNARNDRQKQLEMLNKYEERIKQLTPSVCESVNVRTNIMQMFVIDLTGVLTSGTAVWLPVREQSHADIPEETILYSLNEGRGELVMFGGIQADLNSMQRGINVNSQIVTKDTYFISSRTRLN